MYRTFVVLIAAACGLVPSVAQAQGEWVWFTSRRYFDPLIADPRAAHQQALFPAIAKSVPHLQNQTKRGLVWDIDVGAELPIVARETAAPAGGYLGAGEWGAGFWFAFDFHMLEDLVDVSNPILNTDYRFSGIGKVQRGLSANQRLAFKLQVGHESTHLGDEYSLAARRLYSQFERVNVSYEWLDAALSYETDQTKIRLGIVTTIPFGDSYYDGDTLETAGRPITESRRAWEPVFGVEQRRGCFGDWQSFASLDARWKTVYNYAKSSSETADRARWSVNLLLGVNPLDAGGPGSIGVAAPYVRLYYGVNPHGQFRNDPNFWIVGAGLRFHR